MSCIITINHLELFFIVIISRAGRDANHVIAKEFAYYTRDEVEGSTECQKEKQK